MRGIAGARWVAVENLHLTLCFLGYVNPSLVQELQEDLSRIAVPRFPITLDIIGRFQNSLWISFQNKPYPLFDLYTRVKTILSQHLILEKKKFRPHVTLARFKKDVAPQHIKQFLSSHNPFQEHFMVQDFTLFESILTQKRAVYRPIQVYRLYEHEPKIS